MTSLFPSGLKCLLLRLTPALSLLTLAAAPAPAQTTSNGSTACSPIRTGVLAHVPGGNTVGGEIREAAPRADGYCHIDTPKMIRRLKQLHANTCNYLIWNSRSDWDDLQKEFLPAAQRAGLKVWVYLVPPTESYYRYSYPYKTNYVQWAKALAELSLRYPALEAWAMDDFTGSRTFTPGYVGQMQQAAHAIDPKLRFFVVQQPYTLSEKWLADYVPVIDGVIAPYFDAPYNNVQRLSSLDPQINAAHAVLQAQGRPLYFLIYVGRRFNSPREPTPEYAAEATAICLKAMQEGRLEGVISYGTPLEKHPPFTRANHALEGRGRLSLARPPSRSEAGEWAAASQTIQVDPKAPLCWLSFWHHCQWGVGIPKGLLVEEILIDEQVVWHWDAAAGMRDFWMEGHPLEGPIELTGVLKGKTTAQLTLRVRALQSFSGHAIDVSFDRLKATGFTLENPGFETGKGWHCADSGGALMAAIDRFDPDAPAKVFQAVRRAFGGFSSPATSR
jgi:hypothetical protein